MIKNRMAVIAFLCAGSLAWAASENKGQEPGQRQAEMRQKMKTELGLTAEQEKKLEAHRSQHRTEAEQLWTEMKQKREALKAELEKPKLDMGAVQKYNTELKTVQNKLADHRLAGILAVREILTPDQFKKFMAMGPGGKGGMGARGGRRGNGQPGGPSGNSGKGPGFEPDGMEEPSEPPAH